MSSAQEIQSSAKTQAAERRPGPPSKWVDDPLPSSIIGGPGGPENVRWREPLSRLLVCPGSIRFSVFQVRIVIDAVQQVIISMVDSTVLKTLQSFGSG